MLSTSNEYKNAITESRIFHATADILLADLTNLTVYDTEIAENGIKLEDSVSQRGSFTVGSAIIGQLTLTLNNLDGRFDKYDFTGAIIRLSIGLELDERIEMLNKGIYFVDDMKSIGSTIILTALDNMSRFDTPFKDVPIEFPTTTLNILQSVCNYCGIPLATVDFMNNDLEIDERPADRALTCREIVSYIAQISGSFARINVNGALELKWYDVSAFEQEDVLDGGIFNNRIRYESIDGGNFQFDETSHFEGGTFDSEIPYGSGDIVDGGDYTYKRPGREDDIDTSYNTGDDADGGNFTFSEIENYDGGTFLQTERYHHFHVLGAATISTDDVVITGVRVLNTTEDAEPNFFGVDGYVISIENNPLIQNYPVGQLIANTVGAKIVGMRFRPMELSILSDPSVEAGDVALVTDRKGNTYQTLVSNLTFSIGNYEDITCDAETPSRNSATRYSEATKTIIEARNAVKQELSSYDLAVEQLNDLLTHGFGLYKSKEEQPDGSVIYYMHNKPTIGESSIIWKQTAEAFGYSTDGGQTWKGIDAEGNVLANVLTTIGVIADWIKIGGSVDGVLDVKDANDNVMVRLSKNGITLANGATMMGGSGVLSVLSFQSGGSAVEFNSNNFEKLGYHSIWDYYESKQIMLNGYVPSNFTVVEARITLKVASIEYINSEDGNGVNRNGLRSAKNIRIRKAGNTHAFNVEYWGSEIYWNDDFSPIDRTSMIWGSQWTPSPSKNVQIKVGTVTGNNALTLFPAGQYFTFIVDSASADHTWNNSAYGKLEVILVGYKS